MPSIVKIRVCEARYLPVMDRATDTTDGFVVVKFAGFEEQTSVQKKTLTPKWDEDFRVDIPDDASLFSEPLEFRVYDRNYAAANLKIGSCFISLLPLGSSNTAAEGDRSFTSETLNGWFPIFDTLEGIRGELKVIVKLENVADVNPYSESSGTGVEFFSSSVLDPSVVAVERIVGICDELMVDNDPQYAWANNFTTHRTSNDARLQLLHRLYMDVRRLVGKKAAEMGCNAVLGYQQSFDVEGDSGIVCRGLGTACVISKTKRRMVRERSQEAAAAADASVLTVIGSRTIGIACENVAMPPLRGSNSLSGSTRSMYGVLSQPFLLDVPKHAQQQRFLTGPTLFKNTKTAALLTMNTFPVNLRVRLGGIVSARSVKYLGKLEAKADQETRDQWWAELRAEIQSHALALFCNHVVGYSETCVIFDDVCVLSAIGTAALLKECKPVWKVKREDESEEEKEDKQPLASTPPPPPPENMDKDETQTFPEQDSQVSEQQRLSPVKEEEEENVQELASKVDKVEEIQPEASAAVMREEEEEESTPAKVDDSNPSPDSQFPEPEPLQQQHPTTILEFLEKSSTPKPTQPSSSLLRQASSSSRVSVVLLNEEDATLLASRTMSVKKRRRELRRQRHIVLRATEPCAFLHVPYHSNAAPFSNMRLVPCAICKTKWVAEMMLSTCEPHPMLPVAGSGTLVEARVCKSRGKTDTNRENEAERLGEQLVFLEIELHRQLVLKLKVMGMNAAFSVRSQIHFAYDLIVGVISATAVYCSALPPPAVLRIKRTMVYREESKAQQMMELQEQIETMAAANREQLLKVAVQEAADFREAVNREKLRKTKALDLQMADLKWRRLFSSLGKEAATVAVERINSQQQQQQEEEELLTPIPLRRNNSNGPLFNQKFSTGSGVSGSNAPASNWFTRRKKTPEAKDDATVSEQAAAAALQHPVQEKLAAIPSVSKKRNQQQQQQQQQATEDNQQQQRQKRGLLGGLNFKAPLAKDSNEVLTTKSPPPPPPPPVTRENSPVPIDVASPIGSLSSSPMLAPVRPSTSNNGPRLKKRRSQDSHASSSSSSSSSSESSSSSSSSSSDSDIEESSSEEEDLDEDEAERILEELRGDSECFVLEIHDQTDEDLMCVLYERQMPINLAMCTSDTLPQFSRKHQVLDTSFVSSIRKFQLNRKASLNAQLATFFHQTYALLAFKLRKQMPCVVGGVTVNIAIPTEDTISLTLTATISKLKPRSNLLKQLPNSSHVDAIEPQQQPPMPPPQQQDEEYFGLPALMQTVFSTSADPNMSRRNANLPTSAASPTYSSQTNVPKFPILFRLRRQLSDGVRTVVKTLTSLPKQIQAFDNDDQITVSPRGSPLGAAALALTRSVSYTPLNLALVGGAAPPLEEFRPSVILCSLPHLPGHQVVRYLGRIHIQLIKERTGVSSELGAIYYTFMLESHAIARAHVLALGGNALLSFRLRRTSGGEQRNQAYNLISVSGDAVLVVKA